MTALRLVRASLDEAPAPSPYADRTIFQTPEWLDFLAATQNAEPVVAALKDGDRTVGRFTGALIRKYGLRILGSPFPGWTTSYLGFNLKPGVERTAALGALPSFAFRTLGCVHVEMMDRRLPVEQATAAGWEHRVFSGFEIDLSKDEDTLFAEMSSACRRCIRKARREGVTLEAAEDMGFADDYYAQLEDVFGKQQLVPTYPRSRVRALIEHILPTGHLLLVRARDGEGRCIATGIFPAMNDTMYFWGGASWRPYQILRPNEAVQWFAMRYWKERGIVKYDMGGGGEYKRKYGGREIAVPWVRRSRFALLEGLRNAAQRLHKAKQRMHGRRHT